MPLTLLVPTSEINAEMGSSFGGNRWKIATDSELELAGEGLKVKPFSALATRGGIALRITS